MSDTNGVHKGKYNARYISYDEANRATTRSSMDSLQEHVKEIWNPEVPGRTQRTRLPRAAELSRLTAVMGAVRQPDRV